MPLSETEPARLLQFPLDQYRNYVGSVPSILVIDDRPADVAPLKRSFSAVGLANPMFWARSNQEALQYLSGEAKYADRLNYPVPSVILLDIEQGSGFDLLEWIRLKFPNGALLVVVLTRVEEIRKINRAYSLGANSFLTKPVNTFEVQELVSIFGGYWLLNPLPRQPSHQWNETSFYE